MQVLISNVQMSNLKKVQIELKKVSVDLKCSNCQVLKILREEIQILKACLLSFRREYVSFLFTLKFKIDASY